MLPAACHRGRLPPLLAGLLLTGLLLAGCADRPRRNPLDPQARDPRDLADPLEAFAGDGRVRLRWDFTGFDDIEAIRLTREGGADAVVYERPAGDTVFVDTEVANGVRYAYRLSLLVRDEGEVTIAGQPLATPGPERSWVADAGSGLVWRLTPDGRRALFARGRFVGLAGLAVDGATGAAWVTDARTGLHRIDADGEVWDAGLPFAAGGDLALDGPSRQGWVVDASAGGVYGFDLDAPGDSLVLAAADAAVDAGARLAAAADGGVWAADSLGQRVLWFAADGSRRGEWRDLVGLLDVAASPEDCCAAWALAEAGAVLLRLLPGEAPMRLSSPVPDGMALAVDADRVWVVGPGGAAAVDADGAAVTRLSQVPPGASTVAAAVGHVWIGGREVLWKVTVDGSTYRTELTGFRRIVALAVDPGR